MRQVRRFSAAKPKADRSVPEIMDQNPLNDPAYEPEPERRTDVQGTPDVVDDISVPAALFDISGRLLQANRPFRGLMTMARSRTDAVTLGDLVGGDEGRILYTIAGLAHGASVTLSAGFTPSGNDRRLVTVVPMRIQTEGRILAIIQPEPGSPTSAPRADIGRDLATGLPDGFLFGDRLLQALRSAERNRNAVAVLALSIDHVHTAKGAADAAWVDLVAPEIARRLVAGIRASDTVARIEARVFGILTPLTAAQDSLIVARRVLNAARQPMVVGLQAVMVTATLGVSLYPDDGTEPAPLIHACRQSQRLARAEGGNRCRFANAAMDDSARRQSDIELRLRAALEREEFLIHYQPKIDATRGTIIGMEALLRWQDPVHGLVAPAAFVPVAEEIGLINDIGDWVLRRACLDTVAWRAAGLDGLQVAVNVSARQFRSHDFLERLKAALHTSGLPPEALELEITETAIMQDPEQAIVTMDAVRGMGVSLAIDDFGTGYSSLAHLGRFPITTVKIDRSFVQSADHDHKIAEITRAIISLSRGLNLTVVGEGAETQRHVEFLTHHRCPLIQGYYYSRPLPAQEFEALAWRGLPA